MQSSHQKLHEISNLFLFRLVLNQQYLYIKSSLDAAEKKDHHRAQF